MKFNISNMTVALAAAALGAASCTANYEDINRNPYEVTAEDMERDGYAMRSFMTTMQSWVIPADVNQCQFTDLLLGGPYGGYIADANSGFNTGKFSTYDPQSNWSPVFYRVIYTNEMSNFTELCKVTEDENAIAVAKVVKVAGVHRVADTYGPIPYTQVGTGADPVPLDSEKEVFKAMFADLDAAVEVLTRNRAGMITTDADRLYGGSLERWGRLANSLKLRLAMRIVYTDFTTDDGRTPQQLAEEAVSSELGVIEDNSGNAMYTGFGKDGNPFYVCFFSYKSGAGDHRVAADIASFMNGYDDPRRASYFNESAFSGGGYAGLRNGIQIPDDDRINNFSRLSLAACVPVTGRTHQIRVHFASIGHPLAGDDLYGGHRDRIARQALHCARQSFRVPAYTKVPGGIRLETPVEEHARTVAVESPLPEDMRALLDAEI